MRTKETAILADALYKSLPKTAIDQFCAELAKGLSWDLGTHISEHDVSSFVDQWVADHRTRAGQELQR